MEDENKAMRVIDYLIALGVRNITLYSVLHGDVILIDIADEDETTFPIHTITNDDLKTVVIFTVEGRSQVSKYPTLFPSEALYRKYPCDPMKAWRVWADSNNINSPRAEAGESYWYLDSEFDPIIASDERLYTDNRRFLLGNYFLNKEEAKEAAQKIAEMFRQDRREKKHKQIKENILSIEL